MKYGLKLGGLFLFGVMVGAGLMCVYQVVPISDHMVLGGYWDTRIQIGMDGMRGKGLNEEVCCRNRAYRDELIRRGIVKVWDQSARPLAKGYDLSRVILYDGGEALAGGQRSGRLLYVDGAQFEVMKMIAQQVDSAEASTIAVPPSGPSGSPR